MEITWDHITSLSSEELYTKALQYKSNNKTNDYWLHLLMASNYDHELAKKGLRDEFLNNISYVEPDHGLNLTFYEATSKYSYSAFIIGHMYDNGIGISQDYTKAMKWYERAAENGNSTAMINLGAIYERGIDISQGIDIPQDYAKAIELYERAAEKGNTTAMNYLGNMCRLSIGIPQDYTKAIEWYGRAMEKGSIVSIRQAYYLYSNMVPRNDMLEYFYTFDMLDEIKKYDVGIASHIDTFLKIKQLEEENAILRVENTHMKTHIIASPDGELYFETLSSWNTKIN